MNNVNIFCLLITYFFYVHSQQPLPETYTEQSPIVFSSKEQILKVAYAPDQSSMVYQDKDMKTFFRTGIVSNIS